MSTSVWGGPESYVGDTYPAPLLKNLVKQALSHFSAHGACIALLDESITQMRVYLHLRTRNASVGASLPEPVRALGLRLPGRRISGRLDQDTPLPTAPGESPDDVEDISPQRSELFAPGVTYGLGEGLIGRVWQGGEACILRHEDYLSLVEQGQEYPFHTDVIPTSYLAVPIQEAAPDAASYCPQSSSNRHVLGVIVLYQITPGANFQPKHLTEAKQYMERIALYLQNNRLRRAQQRASEYLRLLQEISTAFPASVQLHELVESMYRFITQVVNVHAMLLTLYDRDTEKMYDIFAVRDGNRVSEQDELPAIIPKDERPVWWQAMQVEQRRLLFSPLQNPQEAARYSELLMGVWGDQRQAETFLMLPMKMFNRVTGSLSLASLRPLAYSEEEIQVLETMLQIVTVSIENEKLYRRDHALIQEGRQREAQLAEVNSALQAIGSELDISKLLERFASHAARVVKVESCAFFQPVGEELEVQALYGLSNIYTARRVCLDQNADDDDDGQEPEVLPSGQHRSEDLLKQIRHPFKNTFLARRVNEGGFFYLEAPELEELARQGSEEYKLFLQEAKISRMLMIPLIYQGDFIGLLAVPAPHGENRFFPPKDVGLLLAICAQAAGAIRNAQLFARSEEAQAELKHLNKLKDEFLVTASHELRTPLSAINGYAGLLRRQGSRCSPQHILRYASKITDATQQLIELVNNINEAARLGKVGRKLDLNIGPVQVRSAVQIAVEMLDADVEQEIESDIDPQLWVQADALHFRQVLSNLLENAVRYSPAQSAVHLSASATTLPQLRPILSQDQLDDGLMAELGNMPVVLVRVRDEGEGILPQDQQRIFEKFVRAPRSLTTPVRGSGLGLYICRRYIEAMGGKLWVEKSVPGEGSTFSFYLPYADPPVKDEGE
ncbi:MAG: hypothetical protein IMW89_09380 [Ktedonobacteraceae bacterium]|nr:hypothetical protein [Ktedonobacteraceae bacterium]